LIIIICAKKGIQIGTAGDIEGTYIALRAALALAKNGDNECTYT
jgi:hypothetical protein